MCNNIKSNTPHFIVIDDDDISNAICYMFIKETIRDAEIHTFSKPLDGVNFISNTYCFPNSSNIVLLLDINMPTLDGWEVLEQICHFDEDLKNRIKTFMLSSSIDSNDKDRALKNPLVTDYIQKPLSFPLVRSLVPHYMSVDIE